MHLHHAGRKQCESDDDRRNQIAALRSGAGRLIGAGLMGVPMVMARVMMLMSVCRTQAMTPFVSVQCIGFVRSVTSGGREGAQIDRGRLSCAADPMVDDDEVGFAQACRQLIEIAFADERRAGG
jgi:hypothetical protein